MCGIIGEIVFNYFSKHAVIVHEAQESFSTDVCLAFRDGLRRFARKCEKRMDSDYMWVTVQL